MIRLSPELQLPIDAVTQTFGILGKKGSGKTTTAVCIAEGMLDTGQQIVIVDPLDVWWGLRSSRDGASAGYTITVIGGDHADVPIEASSGAVIAEFIVERGASVILSLRHLSMSEQRRCVADFGQRLYELKGRSENKTPLHLFIDESDEYVPQRLGPDTATVFGSIDRIVRRGRSSGIGVTLISQRAAALNKDVLTQIDTLIAMRTVGPQDRKALETWVEAHDTESRAKEFLASLASLATGEGWIWSPGWLDIFQRVKFRDRKTFDSSATPKAGSVIAAPRNLAPVDLDQLRNAMAETIERTKADDPRELRKRIAELEKSAGRQAVDLKELEAAEKRGYDRGVLDGIARIQELVGEQVSDLIRNADLIQSSARVIQSGITFAETLAPKPELPKPTLDEVKEAGLQFEAVGRPTPRAAFEPKELPAGSVYIGKPDSSLPASERRILTALAQSPKGLSIQRLAFLSGYTINGHFNNMLGALRTKAFITPARVTPIEITNDGKKALGSYETLPTGRALRQYWIDKVGASEGRILRVLIEAFPHAVAVEDLAKRAGYTVNGHFNNMLGHLRSIGLMSPARTPPKASEELF